MKELSTALQNNGQKADDTKLMEVALKASIISANQSSLSFLAFSSIIHCPDKLLIYIVYFVRILRSCSYVPGARLRSFESEGKKKKKRDRLLLLSYMIECMYLNPDVSVYS